MATRNRALLINRTLKVLKKHYQPVPPVKDRTLFEHLVFACLLENSPHAAAEQVFKSLRDDYFDWNEVRVSTLRELTDVTKPLVDSAEAASRLKQTLHAVFEAVYQFDLESLKKQNIGQAVKQLEKLKGTTPYTVAYVTQHGLGGHSIPINRGLLIAMEVIGVISDGEAKAGTVPGLDRTISKSKGLEYASLLHQLGVEIGRNPYGQAARKLLLEIAPDCKNRLPRRKTAEEEQAEAAAQQAAEQQAAAAKKEARKAAVRAQTAAAKARKKQAKLPAKKKVDTKRPTKGGKKAPTTTKKRTSHKLTKRKPK